ncbi:uncharacterized protein LOC103574651 [Microplitis demolitor]|uniref:uncharacterized protein LOC103574651 n=1 Tax=Microplitis demolitor TaxID=69319 RepID=UPI00044001AF|nr:uncharacterized protein LOC103574651 [Microplitis demolitor]
MSKRTTTGFINSCEKIRPERSRNPCLQRLVWTNKSTDKINIRGTRYWGFDNAVIGDDLQVTNPRVALRRLLRLYEGRQYREAANFLTKLPRCTLASTLTDFPVDLVIETLPRSLSLLEALYSRLPELGLNNNNSNNNNREIQQDELSRLLRVEQLLWKVVHLISVCQDQQRIKIWTKLITYISHVYPNTRKLLVNRKKALDETIEGLGKHGPIPCQITSEDKRSGHQQDTKLLPLTAKFKDELETMIDAYKLALHKIDNFGKDASRRSKGDPHGLKSASHQRLLSLKYSEVQQRLIDNQSLLNTLEKANGRNLTELSTELLRRVEQDKEALRQWTSLRKFTGENNIEIRSSSTHTLYNSAGASAGVSADNATKEQPSLAARLLQFSRACGIVLEMMNKTHDSRSDWSCDFLAAEDEKYDVAESSSAGYHTDDSYSPEPPCPYFTGLPGEIYNNNNNYYDGNKKAHAVTMTTEQLRDKYAALYAQAHLHTLDALDALEPLKEATDLKAKILFSVIVLSWRIADSIQSSRKHEAVEILSGAESALAEEQGLILSLDVEACMRRQLATAGYSTGTRQVASRVMDQLRTTLYDYPCIENCKELKNYALESAHLAWSCLAHDTPLIIDTVESSRVRLSLDVEFRRELHSRHHTSPNPMGKKIVGVIWPGLRQTNLQGPCLYRAVVLTT